MPGTLLNVCTSNRKGTPKRSVKEAYLRLGHGLDGGCSRGQLASPGEPARRRRHPHHGGEGFAVEARCIRRESRRCRTRYRPARHRFTPEHRRCGDRDLPAWKVCHTRCAIYFQTGDCIMPRQGLFASVTRPGAIRAGSAVETVHTVSRHTVQAAVVSSVDGETWAQTTAVMLRERLDAHIAWQGVIPDRDPSAFLRGLASRVCDLLARIGRW